MEGNKLSKGKMIVSTERLKKLFNIPQEVEFVQIKLDHENESVEVIVMSAEPIVPITAPVTDHLSHLSNRRRIRLPIEFELKSDVTCNLGEILMKDTLQ